MVWYVEFSSRAVDLIQRERHRRLKNAREQRRRLHLNALLQVFPSRAIAINFEIKHIRTCSRNNMTSIRNISRPLPNV